VSNLELSRGLMGDEVDWRHIRHFNRSEWSEGLRETSALLIYALDEFRHNLGYPVYISPANWGRHGETSYHYPQARNNNQCWAVDVFTKAPLCWAYHTAVRSRFFAGIGVYPDWEWEDQDLVGGLHLDIREYNSNKKVWWRDNSGYHTVRSVDDLSDMEILMLTSM